MKKTNKLLIILVAGLLLWNSYLGYQLEEIKGQRISTDGYIPSEQQFQSNIESNVSEIVTNIQDKVVSVLTYDDYGSTGSGSGIVYQNKDGKISIITNHHVVSLGSDIIVRFYNGAEYEATKIGSDIYTDLALLEVQADLDLAPFALGDSELSHVGEFVIAIGSPMGVAFENSVTFGIISGKNRVVDVDLNGDGLSDWDMIVMQTDAAINPGNSGGALVNMKGELIGINSLKIASSNVEGMGFSIPINEVIPIIIQIQATGKVNYPVIGITALSVQDINTFQKSHYEIDPKLDKGVLITGVEPNSPAAKAGIAEHDVIVEFSGESINTFKDFRKLLYQHKIGDKVTMKVNRQGQIIEIEIHLQ